MTLDDLIKAGKESRHFGPDENGVALCTCGKTFQAYSTGRDMENDQEGAPSYGPAPRCPDCAYATLRASIEAAAKVQDERDRLLNADRPRWHQFKSIPEFRNAVEDWLWARRRRAPARVRNRCKSCGARVADRLLQACAQCRDAHQRRQLRLDMMLLPNIPHPDLLAIYLKKWKVAEEEEFKPLHEYIAKEKSCKRQP